MAEEGFTVWHVDASIEVCNSLCTANDEPSSHGWPRKGKNRWHRRGNLNKKSSEEAKLNGDGELNDTASSLLKPIQEKPIDDLLAERRARKKLEMGSTTMEVAVMEEVGKGMTPLGVTPPPQKEKKACNQAENSNKESSAASFEEDCHSQWVPYIGIVADFAMLRQFENFAP